ncbi:MAG TPA: PTS sugar transporter subunit IIA [Syntrophomonas sp.]|nr:PTS sugar transporter subunit IIA [Syntrophomonas sp.]
MPLLRNLINPNLIIDNLEAKDKEEALKVIADFLMKNGYVEEGYYEMLLERERKFPTGLATKPFPVAIPHTDPLYVIKPCIIVARLKTPVNFTEMTRSGEVKVRYIFVLVVQKTEEQVNLLQAIVNIFSDKATMKKIDSAQTADKIAEILFEQVT